MKVQTFTTKRIAALAALGTIGVLAYVLAAQVVVAEKAGGAVVTSIDDVSSREVVLAPGARVYADGRPSQFLRQRLEAAQQLYNLDKVGHILLSGDNRASHFNEPEAMRDFVLNNGVAPRDITLDVAGFDTWDTCIRAKEQFGVTKAVVVTQERFANRAAALCSAAGIDTQVLALPTPAQSFQPHLFSIVRERLATVKAWGDIIRKPSPSQGGEFVGLVGSEPS